MEVMTKEMWLRFGPQQEGLQGLKTFMSEAEDKFVKPVLDEE
jgi:hypothetical protein